jgi:NAD(P)-dependent dehydrogenase (short-subunit alcohol dehydrogenase family)
MGNSSSYDKPAEVKSKYFPDFVKSLPSLEGKTIAITGCTTGTGYICARTCCELGASVVMLNRPSKRANEALQSLKDAGHKDVSLVECDLQSFQSVKKASSELRSKFKETGLDVLVNNAGIMATLDKATEDGCDDQMQTNHLSHFLLTSGVWSLLETAQEKRGDARVVNHSSVARSGNGKIKKLDEKYLGKNGGNLGGDPKSWMPGPRWTRYAQTKLANLVFTYALRDRAEKAGSMVKSLCAHPGLAATSLQVKSANDGGMPKTFTNFLMSYGAQSCEDGTMGLLSATAKSDVKSGDFFGPVSKGGMGGMAVLMKTKEEEKLADKESRDMLWRASTEVTGGEFPF